jgi:hypothetical protein
VPYHILAFQLPTSNNRSRDSSVGIATWLLPAGRPSSRGSIPGRDKRLLLFSTISSLLHNGYGKDVSPEVKRQGREANHSPPSAAEVQNCETTALLVHTYSWRRGTKLIKPSTFPAWRQW